MLSQAFLTLVLWRLLLMSIEWLGLSKHCMLCNDWDGNMAINFICYFSVVFVCNLEKLKLWNFCLNFGNLVTIAVVLLLWHCDTMSPATIRHFQRDSKCSIATDIFLLMEDWMNSITYKWLGGELATSGVIRASLLFVWLSIVAFGNCGSKCFFLRDNYNMHLVYYLCIRWFFKSRYSISIPFSCGNYNKHLHTLHQFSVL